MKTYRHLVFFVLGCLIFWACQNNSVDTFKHDPNYKDVYACPNACEKEKVYDKPGECPVCRTRLLHKEMPVNASPTSTRHPDTLSVQ